MGVFEDKQTKATVGGKKQVTEELLNITEVAAHEFFHQKAKLMMRVNWIWRESLKNKETQVTSNCSHLN